MTLNGEKVLVPAANGPQGAEVGRSASEEKEYILDNSHICTEETGLFFCMRKSLTDRMPEQVQWGELVQGQDQGDGWLYMKPRFLPMRLQGVTVLSLSDGKTDPSLSDGKDP